MTLLTSKHFKDTNHWVSPTFDTYWAVDDRREASLVICYCLWLRGKVGVLICRRYLIFIIMILAGERRVSWSISRAQCSPAIILGPHLSPLELERFLLSTSCLEIHKKSANDFSGLDIKLLKLNHINTELCNYCHEVTIRFRPCPLYPLPCIT